VIGQGRIDTALFRRRPKPAVFRSHAGERNPFWQRHPALRV
jgi:hypothetical protein